MSIFKFRSGELLCIDVARRKGKLYLSDVAEIYDLPLQTNFDVERVKRKVRRLLDLQILKATGEGWEYANERDIPESAFMIQFQKRE